MPLITITASSGSGGEEISSMVARGLGLELFDDERMLKEACNMGIDTNEVEGFQEKSPGYLDFLRGWKSQIYLDLMESVVYEIARRGEGVIVGHGSPFLLREFDCALHVLVHAPDSFRVKRIMDRYGLNKDHASRFIGKGDRDRRGFMKFAFHMDWNDLSLYDLVLNPEKIGVKAGAGLIMEAAGSREVKECSAAALDMMERFSLVKKVEAQLLKNNADLSRLVIEASEKGAVDIKGFTYTDEQKELIVRSARAVPGVSRVEEGIVVLPSTGS